MISPTVPSLRVAMFVSGFPVTSETFILHQIVGLLEHGHEVEIFALSARPSERVHELVRRHDLMGRTVFLDDSNSWQPAAQPVDDSQSSDVKRNDSSVRRAARKGMPHGVSKFAEIAMRILSSPALWHPSNWLRLSRLFLNAKGRWSRLSQLRMICRDIEIGGFDIVHCQFGDLGAQVVPLMGEEGGSGTHQGILSGRLVVSFRGHDVTQTTRFDAAYYAELMQCGRRFMPVSDHLGRGLEQLGFRSEQIDVVRSGIDCRKFSLRETRDTQSLSIVVIARLVEMKGVSYALQALAIAQKQLATKQVTLQLNIVGDGPLREKLEQEASELGISDCLVWHGALTHDAVLACLNQADILWAPSVTAANGEQEGIPNSVKEGMAVGLPIVATRHSGIPELVIDGESGFLVPERDVEQLAAQTVTLAMDPELRTTFGRAGRLFVERHYDLPVVYEQLRNAYLNAIDHEGAIQV